MLDGTGRAGAAANPGEQPPHRRPDHKANCCSDAVAPGWARLVLAPAIQLESVAQLEQAYVNARARGNEGVMLKARHSLLPTGPAGSCLAQAEA